jgi:phosphate transport system substrate-binding protein
MSRAIRGMLILAWAVLAAVVSGGCGGSTPIEPPPAAASPPSGSLVVLAAGIDYAAPIYQEAGAELGAQNLTLNYQIVPLPTGAPRLRRPGPPVLAAESSRPLGELPRLSDTSELYVPIAFGALAVLYNLPGVHSLRLTARALSDIYLGRVRNWDSKEIASTNHGVRLPSMPITVLHRDDPATATQLLTQYLATASRHWRRTIGSDLTVTWPTGAAESADATLRQTLAATPGAIGYTDQSTALQNRLPTVSLRNPAGHWIAPTLAATSAVGLVPHGSGSLSVGTINAPVPGAYPVAAEAFMLTARDPCDAGFSHPEASGVQRVLRYMLGPGQGVVRRFSFAPLPRSLRRSAQALVRRMSCGGQPI